MRVEEFDYELPRELVAQYPLIERDASRLLVLDCRRRTLAHERFRDLPRHLKAGDALVINDSRVIPARLFGRAEGATREVELLLLREIEPNLWECLAKPGRKLEQGARVLLDQGAIRAEVVDARPEGLRTVRFTLTGDIRSRLDEIGHTPLPPYIRRPDERLMDRERYQTVYARRARLGRPRRRPGCTSPSGCSRRSAPRGSGSWRVTLHVGLGTFQPVKAETPTQHRMHPEVYRPGRRPRPTPSTPRSPPAAGCSPWARPLPGVLETGARDGRHGPARARAKPTCSSSPATSSAWSTPC